MTRAGNRRPTVTDVAARAGVSVKTASRVLNKEGNVRAEKVERVEAAASDLGFRPNEFARLLRTKGTSSMIGVITGDVGDPFWSGVLRGTEEVLGGEDRFILSASTRDRTNREADIAAAMIERRVMALVVVPTSLDQGYLGDIVAGGTAVVCVDRPGSGADTDTVVAADRDGARRGTELLIAEGHRRIAFVSTGAIYTSEQRLAGYEAALASAGIPFDPDLVAADAADAVTQVEAVVAFHDLADPPTAVFSANVATSLALLARMRADRWNPAVVAFSDFDGAEVFDPSVTTIHNDPVELGRRAGQLILERLDGYDGPPRFVTIDTPLILRESHRRGR